MVWRVLAPPRGSLAVPADDDLDWPSFKASQVRSVRAFESSFIRIAVRGANTANVTYVVEGWPDTSSDIPINTSVAAASPDLGDRCLAVWQICRDRAF